MRAHTITTKASKIVPGGILALGLAVVLLGATASSASAGAYLTPWYCPPTPSQSVTFQQTDDCRLEQVAFHDPTSFDFGNRQVGTTSPAQRFALLVPDTFDPSISVSGDYAQTNDCPPTLSAPGQQYKGCLINVTFAPTGTGPKGGTLSTGPRGPTGTFTGTGVTTPTPPALPPILSVSWKRSTYAAGRNVALRKKLPFTAVTNSDSTLVATGDVKKTTKQLAAGEKTKVKTKLKHLERLREKAKHDPPKVKVKFTATDEFGQTATDGFPLRLWPQE